MAEPSTLAGKIFRRYLQADSPRRERSISIAASCTIIFALLGVSLTPEGVGPQRLVGLQVVFGGLLLYETFILGLLSTGRYSPAIPWISALVETSSFALGLCVDALYGGGEQALLSPSWAIWGALITLTSLRMTPRLSIVTGVVAALEFIAVYILVIHPRIPVPPVMSELASPAAGARAVLLMIDGLFGAVIAQNLFLKAEEALRTVREQDLMGKYLLHERLGVGGMAEVFRATYCPEGGFAKTVAIKRVLPRLSANAEFRQMFLEEARLGAQLIHPNIVQVSDCGRFQDTFILAMEFVDGMSLGGLLKTRPAPLPLAVVTYVGAELAYALDYIHRRIGADGNPLNLIHRDLNPANVLVSRFGEVKLADFGVAHAINRAIADKKEMFFGKVPYAAPEQLTAGAIDGRVDLFALGLTLHELLTGHRVARGTQAQVLATIVECGFPRASEVRADVPPGLDELIARLLRHDPQQRPQTGAEARAAFCALSGPAAPYPSGAKLLAELIQGAVGLQEAGTASVGSPQALAVETVKELKETVALSPRKTD